MKKSLLVLAAAVGVAFALISLAKWRASERVAAGAGLADAEKTRIKTFWAAYSRANAFRIQGDFAHAAPAYRDALQIDPQHEDSLYYLGASQEELGEYAAAAETLHRLLAVNPSSGRALGELGNILSLPAPGAPVDYPAARQALLRNVDVNREQAGPFLRLGGLELNEGRLDPAFENFRIAAGFGSSEGNFSAGYVRFLQKRYPEAMAYFGKVLDAYGRDKKIIGKGVLSEGDVLPAPGKPLTALERSGLESLLFLYWAARQAGGYPAAIPKEFRIEPRRSPASGLPPPQYRFQVSGAGFRELALTPDPRHPAPALLLTFGPGAPVRLLRSEGERTVDATRSSGLANIRDVWDASSVDYDGDGYPDLYFIRAGYLGSGQNLLYHNNGDGTFSDVTAASGLEGARATARAHFFDFDGDGRPDLLEVGAGDASHNPVRLFHNTGKRFVEVTQQAGLAAQATAVDCAVADYDLDGKPDLFVLFWKQDAVLYHNLGNGAFANVTEQAGLKGIAGESFSALFFDYNRDGLPDLFVSAHAPYEEAVRCLLQPGYAATRGTPRLFRNLGNGKFEEATERLNLKRAYGTMQALAADLDGDGWPDLLLINGSLDAGRLEPSVVLRNMQGRAFREWSYFPSFDTPANFLAGSLAGLPSQAGAKSLGAAQVYLTARPLFPLLSH